MARAAIHHTEEQSPRPSPQAVPEFCLVVGCRLSWDNAGVTETISANQSYKEGSIAPAQILPTTGQRVWWSRDEGRGGGGVGRGRGVAFLFQQSFKPFRPKLTACSKWHTPVDGPYSGSCEQYKLGLFFLKRTQS